MRSVKIRSCRNLLIGLDLTGVNPTKIPFTFIHSSKVTVDFITFDKSYAGNQKLVTKFRNIETVSFQGLHVDEAIEVIILSQLPENSCSNKVLNTLRNQPLDKSIVNFLSLTKPLNFLFFFFQNLQQKINTIRILNQ